MTGLDLPRDARLRQAADFGALRHAKGRVRGTYFMLRYGPNACRTARLGMAVSRRVSTRAVERNRIKRLIRESFRQRRAHLPHVDILVIAHRDAAGKPAPALRGELEALWSRVRPLKGAPDPGKMTD